MHLTLDTIPRAFTSQVYDVIYSNHTLYPPPDANQRGFCHTAKKIVLALLRGALQVCTFLCVTPVGMGYHLLAAIYFKVCSWTIRQRDKFTEYSEKVQRASVLAFEHLKAIRLEIGYMYSDSNSTSYHRYPAAITSSSTPIQIDEIVSNRADDHIFNEID